MKPVNHLLGNMPRCKASLKNIKCYTFLKWKDIWSEMIGREMTMGDKVDSKREDREDLCKKTIRYKEICYVVK